MIKFKNIMIFKTKQNLFNKTSIWVLMQGSYLYLGKSLLQLLKIYILKYKSNKHLVG